MVRDSAFIITSISPWEGQGQGEAQALARELSLTHKVLYVNPPMNASFVLGEGSSFEDHRERVMQGIEPALRKMGDRLWVLEAPVVFALFPHLITNAGFDYMNRKSARRYARSISWAAEYLGLEHIALLVDNDIFRSFYLDEFLAHDKLIYFRRLDLTSLPYWRSQGSRLEPRLLHKCDLVVTTTDELAEEVYRYNPNTYTIGSGVDLTLFDAAAPSRHPVDMTGIPHPIIGMTDTLGALHYSPNLIYKCAQQMPDVSFVLVGGEDSLFSRHPLHRLDNVYFLGDKSPGEMASYIASFDICINPEVRNPLTVYTLPERVLQYLAMGKNVVSTEVISAYGLDPYVFSASGHEEFVSMCRLALGSNPSPADMQEKSEVAATFSWSSCVDKLMLVMEMGSPSADDPSGDPAAGYDPACVPSKSIC